MPGGLAFDSTQSYIAFGIVKFVRYSLAGLYLINSVPGFKGEFFSGRID
jgi:hypothetical protein